MFESKNIVRLRGVLLLCQDVVQLLHQLRDVTLTGLSPCAHGRRLMQLHVTVAGESDHAESDVVLVSTEPECQCSIDRPRRVAVAELSSENELMNDDNDEDGSPWEIRSDPLIDKPPSHRSASVLSDGVPLLSNWPRKNCITETSPNDVTRFDEAEIGEVLRRSTSLDVPLQQLPSRYLHLN